MNDVFPARLRKPFPAAAPPGIAVLTGTAIRRKKEIFTV